MNEARITGPPKGGGLVHGNASRTIHGTPLPASGGARRRRGFSTKGASRERSRERSSRALRRHVALGASCTIPGTVLLGTLVSRPQRTEGSGAEPRNQECGRDARVDRRAVPRDARANPAGVKTAPPSRSRVGSPFPWGKTCPDPRRSFVEIFRTTRGTPATAGRLPPSLPYRPCARRRPDPGARATPPRHPCPRRFGFAGGAWVGPAARQAGAVRRAGREALASRSTRSPVVHASIVGMFRVKHSATH